MREILSVILASALALASSGCVSSAVKDQSQRTATAHDQYAALVRATLDGSIAPQDGAPVTKADLAATPPSVVALLQNVVRALYLSRQAWHAQAHALGVGPDPATLSLDPPPIVANR